MICSDRSGSLTAPVSAPRRGLSQILTGLHLAVRSGRVTPTAHSGYTVGMRYLGIALTTATFVAILAAANSQPVVAAPTGSDNRNLPQRMMDAHDCWSGQAPADMRGKIPAHAVVELDAERGPQYAGSQVGFDIWLHGHPGTLYGFCR